MKLSNNTHRDAVYRALFQIEAGKRDATRTLCDSLQAAWLDDQAKNNPSFEQWLKQVTPICLAAIASSRERSAAPQLQTESTTRQSISFRGVKMQIRVEQGEGVRFALQARNHTIVSDQPQDNGGSDTGMTPPELLLASLGSCAAYYAAEYLRTRKLAETGVSVSVDAEKLKGPARIGNFRIRVQSPVDLTPDQQDAMIRSVEHCLVKNTLLNPPEIQVSLDPPAAISSSAS